MNTLELIHEIRLYCNQKADPVSLQKYQRYFKGGYDGYGLNTTAINNKVRELLRDNGISIDTVIEAAPALMESGMYEETSFALLLLNEYGDDFSGEVFESIGKWFLIGINNWAHADTLGMYILPKFIAKNIIEFDDFVPWINSSFKFQRRCVPVTLLKSIKKQNISTLLSLIKPLMYDSEREVHQGVGWFLREAWKENNSVVEEYLSAYKETAPRLIIQYACEKMSEEDRGKYRRINK
jgi:3-methyladenine DNA glycosylase AlkD